MTVTGDIIYREILEITDNRGGSRKIEKKYTITDARIAEWDIAIIASMTDTVIWSESASPTPLASFSFVNLLCDVDLEIEVTVVGAVTDRSFVIKLLAGVPMSIHSNYGTDGTGAGVADGFGGADDAIGKIAVRETNGSAGELHILMALET